MSLTCPPHVLTVWTCVYCAFCKLHMYDHVDCQWAPSKNSFSTEHIFLSQVSRWEKSNSGVDWSRIAVKYLWSNTYYLFFHLFNASPRKDLSQFNDYRVQTVVDNGVTRQPNCVVRTEVQAPPHWQRLPIREFNRKSMWYIRPIFLLLSSWWNIQSQILVCVQAVLLRIPCEYFLLFDWSETKTYSMWTFRESPFARFVQRHSLLFCEPTLLSQKFK